MAFTFLLTELLFTVLLVAGTWFLSGWYYRRQHHGHCWPVR